ncbi:histidine kinase [Paenibacillus pectinilyticus]|uniref:Histidine kinase n=1 Tax=Paenibacillus pectinilyticus TaxID=512399 RepID=A0A1C1A4R0_9BACL|nr:sensor histidine kinase [Paenibacillus pectinilyticus]OCT15551.1 histidine kinase [Paenibacillus pectinilyticus]
MGLRSMIDTYRHMRIKNKLSILITLIIALSLTFTIITQQYVFSIYDGQIYEKSSSVLNLSSTAIETELKRLQQLSYRIMSEEQVQDWLTSLKKNPSDYDRLIISQYLIDRLISYSGEEPYLYSIQIMDASGNDHEGGNILKMDEDRKKQVKAVAADGMGENRWIYPDSKDPALIITREIRSFHKTNFDLDYLGTLVIRINIDKIVRDIAPEEGDVMIVSDGSVIFPREPSFDWSRIAKPKDAVKGYEIQQIDDKEYFIAQIQSHNTGWTYLNITPFNQIFDRIVFIKEMVVFVFIAIFAVVILLGIRFSIGLTRPIDELMIRMKLAEKGNFEEANLFPSGGQVAMNEIGLLQRSFRFMIERINTLIQENYANRLLLKETEFKALQSQINPHFLYNTLESINWMAKVNKQAKISEMVEALAYLLRHSVDLKEPIIPLSEEIDIVRSYVTIQKIRFEERLVFKLDVPDELMGRSIPKLTLQPLMENAIHYALESTIEPCEISIRGWSTEEGIFLAVEDTGPGIPRGIIERLRSGEVTTKGKGIGLLNIDDRIKLAFGETYGIRVDETVEHGARVILILPKGLEE